MRRSSSAAPTLAGAMSPPPASSLMPVAQHKFPARRPLTCGVARSAARSSPSRDNIVASAPDLLLDSAALFAGRATQTDVLDVAEDEPGRNVVLPAETEGVLLRTTGRTLSATGMRKAEYGLQAAASTHDAPSHPQQQRRPTSAGSWRRPETRASAPSAAIAAAYPYRYATHTLLSQAPTHRNPPALALGVRDSRHRQWKPAVPLRRAAPLYSATSELLAIHRADEGRRLGAAAQSTGWVRSHVQKGERLYQAWGASLRAATGEAFSVPVRPVPVRPVAAVQSHASELVRKRPTARSRPHSAHVRVPGTAAAAVRPAAIDPRPRPRPASASGARAIIVP